MAIPYSVAKLHAVIRTALAMGVDEGLTKRSYMWDRVRKQAGSGKGIPVHVKTSANTSVQAGFTVGGALSAPGAAETIEGLVWWGNYAGSFKLADRQLKVASSARDRHDLGDLIEFQADDLISEIVSSISTDLISGATHSENAGTIVGLTGGLIEDDNAHAGIDRSTYTSYACYVNDNGGSSRAVTDTLIRATVDYLMQTIEGNRPSVMFCGYALWNSIAALSGTSTTINVTETPSATVSKYVGITDLFFEDIPIVKVPGYTTGRLDMINEDAHEVRFLPVGDVPKSEATFLDAIDLKEPEQDGDALVWKMFVYLQQKLRNPRKNAASLQDLST